MSIPIHTITRSPRSYQVHPDASAVEEHEPRIADVVLPWAESLDLPVVLAQVARDIATLLGGVCQVHFAPPQRPADARRVVADPHASPERAAAPGGEAASATVVTHLGEPEHRQHAVPRPPAPELSETQDPLPWAHRDDESSGALVSAPLVARGQGIGTIDVVLPAPPDADLRAQQHLVRRLAMHAALAIDTADRVTRLQASPPATQRVVAEPDDDSRLALLAHDLRNTLTALQTSVQLVLRMTRDAQELNRERLGRLAELANAAIGRMDVQIRALMPTRDEGSKSTRTSPPIDLVRTTQLLVDIYQQTTGRHTLRLRQQVPELSGPWAQPHLERMIGNLLSNAIKYSPDGGVITVTVAQETDSAGGWAVFCVQNAGIGIPHADLPHIGRAGYRAGNVDVIPGTGFGLASVREVVEHYGGTLVLQSAVGEATTVCIRLPLNQNGMPQAGPG